MAVLTVRNLPDEVHRALRVRAAGHGRSTEAEVRAILEETVKPKDQEGFGTMLWRIGREAGVTDEDVDALMRIIEENRQRSLVEPMSFDE
jgi:plasmid stability protein